jgi:hypothetical protein
VKKLAILLLAFTLSIAEYAETNVFMVYGQDFSVGVPLPDNWTVDMNFAISHNLNGFFFPQKYSLQNSPVAMLLSLA